MQLFRYTTGMEFIKSLIPESLLKFIRPFYHGLVAVFAAIYFGRPSEKMVVIGVTGTSGKSTTAAMLAHIFNVSNKKCGYISTVNFFDGKTIHQNKHGLSMPGGWLMQKQLALMLRNACKYAIVECTSEGLGQNRHLGINFDAAVFTNLTQAHLLAHGSFGNYQKAKSLLFSGLERGGNKSFFPQKIIVANLDDPMSGFFLSFPASKKFSISFSGLSAPDADKVFSAWIIEAGPPIKFEVDGQSFVLDLLGEFNAKNAGLAATAAFAFGVDLKQSASALKSFLGVAGRMEAVPNALGIKIIVDYGCEPASFKSALEATVMLPHTRLIHVFGSTGGHRDVSKRFEFGNISAQYANIIIITNDDVYSSDPMDIAKNIESGIKAFKLSRPEYEIILDRKTAIARALVLAREGDTVLITGKGSERFLVLPQNKRIEWDDVSVVKQEIAKLV